MSKKKQEYAKNFNELTYENVDIAGGKGASLGEMAQNKFPIPPGFVVLASAFDKFLEETDLNIEIDAALKEINYEDVHNVEEVSAMIKDMIMDEKIPEDIREEIFDKFEKLGAEFVAVRSSATAEDSSIASWAGELESYLNTTKRDLLRTVKKCWASLFTPRAIVYRFEKNLQDQKVSVAVVIQKMIQSEVSGICFTVHPVTNDDDQMVIEAGWGLGEAIVGGMVTPDTAVLTKEDLGILDINISEQTMMITRTSTGTKEVEVPKARQEKQKLSGEKLIDLAKICLKIEKHYKKPQDIEWAVEKNKIYITQSRPITTLN